MTKPVRCGFEFELPGSKHLSFPTVILMDQAVHRRSHLACLPMLLADRTPVAVRVVVWLQHGVCAGSWAELGVGENRPLGTSNLRLSWTGVQSKLCFLFKKMRFGASTGQKVINPMCMEKSASSGEIHGVLWQTTSKQGDFCVQNLASDPQEPKGWFCSKKISGVETSPSGHWPGP